MKAKVDLAQIENPTLRKRLEELDARADSAGDAYKWAIFWIATSMLWYAGFIICLARDNMAGSTLALLSAIISYLISRHYQKQATRIMEAVIREGEAILRDHIRQLIKKDPEDFVKAIAEREEEL
jgi:hypothetical protein